MKLPGESIRLDATFKSFDGVLYDPASQTIKIYDATGVPLEAFDQDDLEHPGVGEFYLVYDIPVDTTALGRWVCQWTPIDPESHAGTQHMVFYVGAITWPTIEEVRMGIGDISGFRLTDEVIDRAIYDAVARVDNEKSSTATQAVISKAYYSLSVALAYRAYCSLYERSLGVIPPALTTQLSNLELEAARSLVYTMRSNTARMIVTQTMPESEYDKGLVPP